MESFKIYLFHNGGSGHNENIITCAYLQSRRKKMCLLSNGIFLDTSSCFYNVFVQVTITL